MQPAKGGPASEIAWCRQYSDERLERRIEHLLELCASMSTPSPPPRTVLLQNFMTERSRAMSANHYWLGRIHGMMEAKAITEHALRLGMGLPSALDTVEQIADEIKFELEQGDRRMLAARLTCENLEALPVDLLQKIRCPI